MRRIMIFGVALAAIAAVTSAWAAPAHRRSAADPPATAQGTTLHSRSVAAVSKLASSLDDALVDFPSARLRSIQGRLVQSVYADDEGHSDRVPWTHRGGIILVLCGEVNAKNRSGGYSGWSTFAFEPAQRDVVQMHSLKEGRPLTEVDIGARDKLLLAEKSDLDAEWVGLLCASPGAEQQVDPTDLSSLIRR